MVAKWRSGAGFCVAVLGCVRREGGLRNNLPWSTDEFWVIAD